MKGAKVLFSSTTTDKTTQEWETPQKLFNYLNSRLHFELDAAATPENAKCPAFYTADDDGLKQVWAPRRVWLNPPYGRNVGIWVKKSYEESQNGALVVCLLPARTDTAWFADYCMKAGQIWFFRGRLRFGDSVNGAPFPSMLVFFSVCMEGTEPKIYVFRPERWGG